VACAVGTLPRVQTKAQEDLPLEEVSAGQPYRVRGVAPRADHLIDGCRHGSVECLPGGIPHMQYAPHDGVLATCFKEITALVPQPSIDQGDKTNYLAMLKGGLSMLH
jgi:hypothetical protein